MHLRFFTQTLSVLIFALFLAACEPKEHAIVLPAAGPATRGSVTMGELYEQQVFFDFEQNTIVATSITNSWDLAFEATKDGSHIFMNGGKGLFLYNTHQQNFSGIRDVPPAMTPATCLADDASGNPDSTAMNNWQAPTGESKQEVIIAKMPDKSYFKFVVRSVNNNSYNISYARLEDSVATNLTLVKEDAYNFCYFSFAKGVVMPEPPKASWDVVFTRYRFIYRPLGNLPYEVNGVLLNPYKVTAAVDSLSTFEAIDNTKAAGMSFTAARDVIGFDWKTYDFNSQKYTVNRNKCYVLRSRNERLYKLHFLDFYSPSGVKGSPSFEFQQIQ